MLDRSASQPSRWSRQMSSQMAHVKDRAWCVVVWGREASCTSREPLRSPRADCPVVLHLGTMSHWVSVYLNLLLPGLNFRYICCLARGKKPAVIFQLATSYLNPTDASSSFSKLLRLGQELPNPLVKTGRIVGNHHLRGSNAVGKKCKWWCSAITETFRKVKVRAFPYVRCEGNSRDWG